MLRSSRELSHKSASDRVFETLGIGLFKLERHPLVSRLRPSV